MGDMGPILIKRPPQSMSLKSNPHAVGGYPPKKWLMTCTLPIVVGVRSLAHNFL